MSALEHVLGGWAMMVAAWWVNGYPHDDDGVDVPLRRLAERQTWALRSDPGLSYSQHSQPDVESSSERLAARHASDLARVRALDGERRRIAGRRR